MKYFLYKHKIVSIQNVNTKFILYNCVVNICVISKKEMFLSMIILRSLLKEIISSS